MDTYKEDNGRFNVAAGDVWAAGDYVHLVCGDIHDQRTRSVLSVTAAGARLCYTDPPWDAGNARNFRRKAGHESVPVDFPDLLRSIITAQAAPVIACEMGRKATPLLTSIMEDAGYPNHVTIPITYYRVKPCTLTIGYADWPVNPARLGVRLNGQDDDDTPRICIEALTSPGDLVVDPCFGRGLTAVTCAATGRRFTGSELHPRRMAITLQKLERDYGLRVGKAD